MSTVEPEGNLLEPEVERTSPRRVLSLVKPFVPVVPTPVDEPDDGQDELRAEDPEEAEDEVGASLIARSCIWCRSQWQGIVGLVDPRDFLHEAVSAVGLASRYVPRRVFAWIGEPDPRKDGREAYLKIGVRLLVVVTPLSGLVTLAVVPGRSFFIPMEIVGVLVASFLISDAARLDARLRKRSREKKDELARLARKKRLADRHGLTLEEIEQVHAEHRKSSAPPAPTVSLTKEPVAPEAEVEDEGQEPEPIRYTEEDVNRYVWRWVLEKIGEKNGIHLDVLLELAQKETEGPKLVDPGTTITRFSSGLKHRGVTVGQVKVDGANRTGIKKTDVESLVNETDTPGRENR